MKLSKRKPSWNRKYPLLEREEIDDVQDGIESRIDGIKARTPEVELQGPPLVWKRENWFETKGSEQGNSWSNWGQKRPQVDRRAQYTCVYACLAGEKEKKKEREEKRAEISPLSFDVRRLMIRIDKD